MEDQSKKRHIQVVGAAILSPTREGLLVFERLDSGGFEFPGGKIEIGESPEQALAREIQEELGVRGQVGERLGVAHGDFPKVKIDLTVYWFEVASYQFHLQDHLSFKEIQPRHLGKFVEEKIVELDRGLLAKALEEIHSRKRSLS
jgi:mutator protein MutT